MNLINVAIILAMYKKFSNPKTSIAIVKDNLGRVLLLRRSKTDNWMPNHWALPGGHIELLETAKTAIIRELKEETNLDALDVKKIKGLSKRDALFFISAYSGMVNLDKASHGFEHSDYIWIYPEDIPSLDKVVPSLKTKKNINLIQILG